MDEQTRHTTIQPEGKSRFDALLALNENELLRAFRHGVMLVLPLLLAAAAAVLINNFPLTAYQTFMTDTFGPGWKEPGALLYNSTLGILALSTSMTLSARLVLLHNDNSPLNSVLPINAVITSFSCLFIIINPTVTAEGMLFDWGGIRGLFGALVVSFIATKLLLRFCRMKALRLSFFSEGADIVLPHMFDTLLPVLCTLLSFVAFREVCAHFGVESLHAGFYNLVRGLFTTAEDGFTAGAIYALLVQVFWFFGIHGADLLDAVTHGVLVSNMELNSLAINSHQVPTHIVTKYFFDVYVHLGGSGATLALIIGIFLKSNDSGTRRVAALSAIPGLFNINELLVFGLPIVLNPAFLLPFVFVPLILFLVSYCAVATGLAPLPVYQVDWITPPLINVIIATDSWRGLVLQLFNISLATAAYIPFVRLADREKIHTRRRVFEELSALVQNGHAAQYGQYAQGLYGDGQYGLPVGYGRLMDKQGAEGALARSLVNDLKASIHRAHDKNIRLYFQPRINMVEKKVQCVEALLRWSHPFYGEVPARLTLQLASEAGLSEDLDNHVLRLAFAQQADWRRRGVLTAVSINLSRDQLEDAEFPALLEHLYALYKLPAEAVVLEVRESLALSPDARYISALQAIHATGATLVVDDFGMAHQTLARIKKVPLSELQIDNTLVEGIDNDSFKQDVVGAIQEMCLNMGIQSSAEYLESDSELETLLELNVSSFQGHYFSRAVTAEECERFVRAFAASGLASVLEANQTSEAGEMSEVGERRELSELGEADSGEKTAS